MPCMHLKAAPRRTCLLLLYVRYTAAQSCCASALCKRTSVGQPVILACGPPLHAPACRRQLRPGGQPAGGQQRLLPRRGRRRRFLHCCFLLPGPRHPGGQVPLQQGVAGDGGAAAAAAVVLHAAGAHRNIKWFCDSTCCFLSPSHLGKRHIAARVAVVSYAAVMYGSSSLPAY